jgi:hypothetical protein
VTDQTLTFHPLTFVDDHDGILVGRADADSYAVFPPEGVDLLRRLMAGETPRRAQAAYEAETGESFDVPDFVDTLEELGFVAHGDETAARAAAPWQRRLARTLLSIPGALVFGALTVLWLVQVHRHPDLAPRTDQVLFSRSIVAAQLLLVFGQFPFLFLHEFFHVLAGWREGLPSRLRVSSRLFFIVFETNITGLLGLPRRRRYLAFLAGMAIDVFVILFLGVLAGATRSPDGSLPLAGRLALALAIPVAMRLLWQGLVFLRTDVYFLVATALGCHDLDGAARFLLRDLVNRVTRRPRADRSEWSGRDLAIAYWYAPVAVVGSAFLIVTSVAAVIPLMTTFWTQMREGVATGYTDPHFWDTTIALAIVVAQLGILAYLTWRDRNLGRAGLADQPDGGGVAAMEGASA